MVRQDVADDLVALAVDGIELDHLAARQRPADSCHGVVVEDDVIAASAGCQGLLVQYAPVNRTVFAARPEIRIASRYGAGFDTINVADARDHGIWVANSPDYGVGEVATHALALALSSVSLGLGFVWAIVDEDTLCWHDRITRTYPVDVTENR